MHFLPQSERSILCGKKCVIVSKLDVVFVPAETTSKPTSQPGAYKNMRIPKSKPIRFRFAWV